MKHLVFVVALTLLSGTYGLSQTTEAEGVIKKQNADTLQGWKKGGLISLNLTQVSLTNWAAGGQNSLSFNGLISLFANKKVGKNSWDNSLDLGYGVLKQGKNSSFIKTDDKFDFMSKLGRKASDTWYYAGLYNLKTQLAPGYNYPNDSVRISSMFAPAYMLAALGMDHKPNDNFSLFIAPLTAKMTFVNDQVLADAGAFGVEKAVYDSVGTLTTAGKKFRGEFGGYLRMLYTKNIMENVTFQTKMDLFSNYLHNPTNIDVNWEVLISMKVNKYITASLTTHLLYDDDIDIGVDTNDDGIVDEVGPRTQFKEILGIGFSYKF